MAGKTEQKQFIFICCGKDCVKHGAKDIMKHAYQEIKKGGLKGKVEVVKTRCTDRCKHGPVVIANNELTCNAKPRTIDHALHGSKGEEADTDDIQRMINRMRKKKTLYDA